MYILSLVSVYYPCWQKGETQILSNYKSFERQQMNAYLNVQIGLSKVNVTLLGRNLAWKTRWFSTLAQSPTLNYNEQFELRNSKWFQNVYAKNSTF